MSDIDRYLAELRSHLTDLNSKRIDEIVVEARSHLEARVEQLRAAGVGEDEAMREALTAFGDPGQVAARLTAANGRHASVSAFRAFASIAMLWGAILAVAIGSDAWYRIVGLPLTDALHLGRSAAMLLMLITLVLPAAVFAGMIAGRRRWWIPGLAPAVLYTVFVLAIAWAELLVGRWEDSLLALAILLCALFVGVFSYLGSRVVLTGRRRPIIDAVAVSYFLVVLAVAITGLRDAAGALATIGVVEASLGILGLAALWDRYRWRSPIFWTGCLVCLLAAAAMAALGTSHRLQFDPALAEPYWLVVVLAQSAAWLALVAWYRLSRRAQTGGIYSSSSR